MLPHVAICVPVRDEEALLPCLLRACAGLDMAGVSATLCLYLDGCSDGSAGVVGRMRTVLPMPVLTRSGPRHRQANAGRARRAAMALGLDVLGAAGGVLLSTDADSRPEPDWVQAAVHALAAADLAAGRLVRIDGAHDLTQTRLELYLDRLHAHRRRLDPVPWDSASGCHFGGGANLAFRADIYRALGGFEPRSSGEDAALLDDAARAGWRVRREPAMLVHTSSRRVGRAPEGLAAALGSIDARGMPLVAHPAAADWQYRAQALARGLFPRLDRAQFRGELGRVLGLSADHVLGVARDCPNAEAFCMRVVPAAPGGERLVPLFEAEEALARLEQARCEQAA